jgi:NAD(P)-dependent dehydrogenase (short-subunit alcohol dehydrogenase family)
MGILEGKIAVITGAGRGIGRSHALLFAREGAKVVVNDPGCNRDGSNEKTGEDVADRVVQEIVESGGDAVACKNPVGTMESAARIVRSAIDAYGRIDVLVNNAGILRDRTILNITEDEWDTVLNVHLKGSFTCLKAAATAMVEQGTGGRIINTSSSSGLLGNFGQANYGAAKAGIYALSRIASMELAKHRITVNAIAPIAMTRMMEDLPQVQSAKLAGGLKPETVSPAVAFLASDAAAKITGMVFGIEGRHLFTYRMMTSHGADSFESGGWTVEEIGKRIDQIALW